MLSAGGFRDTNQWLAWLTANAWPSYAGDHLAHSTGGRLITGALAAWGIAFTVIFPFWRSYSRRKPSAPPVNKSEQSKCVVQIKPTLNSPGMLVVIE